MNVGWLPNPIHLLFAGTLGLLACSRPDSSTQKTCPSPASNSADLPAAPDPADPEIEEHAYTSIDAQAMADALWPEGRPPQHRDAIADRRERMAELVESVTRASTSDLDLDLDALRRLAHRAGYELRAWELEGRRYLALLEESRHRSGGGAYILRVGARTPIGERELVLQAPHAFYDLGSGRVALRLFIAAGDDVRALFVNTTHRHTQHDGTIELRETNPADVTLNDEHLFAVATEQMTRVLDDPTVLQVHGFDNTQVAGQPDAIISTGSEASSPASIALAKRLGSVASRPVVRYPEQTAVFGATYNVEGKRVRAVFTAEFFHVELSRAIRSAVLEQEDFAPRLWGALAEPSEPDEH